VIKEVVVASVLPGTGRIDLVLPGTGRINLEIGNVLGRMSGLGTVEASEGVTTGTAG